MKDLKIPVLMVALTPLHDFPIHFVPTVRVCSAYVFKSFSNKAYKAPFLECQDHARMKYLNMLVLMVALKPLHDFPRPISWSA